MGIRESSAMPAGSSRLRSRPGMEPEAPLGDGRRRRTGANLTALVKDCMRLIDLQLQLLAIDGKEFWRSVKIQLMVVAMAGVVGLAAMTITLAALAEFLVLLTGSQGWSLLAIGGGGLVISGVLLAMSAAVIKNATGTWGRSNEELRENVRWIRDILHHDEHAEFCEQLQQESEAT